MGDVAELVVLGFGSRNQAERVRQLGRRLSRAGMIELADEAVAWRDEAGRVRVRHPASRLRPAAVSGAVCGAAVGAAFLAPVAGLLVGAAGGAVTGRLVAGETMDTAMVRRVAGCLQPGRAAVFVLVSGSQPGVVEALRHYQPMVIRTSMPRDREEALIRALRGQELRTERGPEAERRTEAERRAGTPGPRDPGSQTAAGVRRAGGGWGRSCRGR
ncbi:DUF1269 domain-containing protein [Parafrankia elaeagni]|uniref:DUF1269 domain-containing protein n=1 Tax=Parafrankia elaeagni TaxID=222534 RepID=UPI00035D97CB